jgi:hypothetical protein
MDRAGDKDNSDVDLSEGVLGSFFDTFLVGGIGLVATVSLA